MTEPTVDLLTTLRNDALLELFSGAVVLAISGGSLLNKRKQNNSIKKNNMKEIDTSIIPPTSIMSSNTPSVSSLFQFSYGLGLVYGMSNVTRGTMNLMKYSSLLSDSKLPRFHLSFYLTIPFKNLVDGQPGVRSFYPYAYPYPYPSSIRLPSKDARFNISELTNVIIAYLNRRNIKLVSLDIEDADTGSSSSGNTISSNVKIDITFIILTKSKTPEYIIANILNGTLNINGYKLTISADKSPTLNADVPRNV
jgi:hypothetical protein